ncbi:unnamed protein product [Closterium sp. Naga37s-1]|nr:unnamed protein product [Closterium sp. Naga37s-1]
MAHLPLSIWELAALRSLSIRNPAFHPGVQRNAYVAGVAGLRHLSCLQLLGHPVPGLMMAALGGNHLETTARDGVGRDGVARDVVGRDGVEEQQQHQPQEEQQRVGGNEQQQQQQQWGRQGGEQASGNQQLEQLRMSRGTVAVLTAHHLIGPAADPSHPAVPAANPALPAAPAANAAPAAAEEASGGAGEGRQIAELEVDGDLLVAAMRSGASLPSSLTVLSVTPSPAVAPSFLPQAVRLDLPSLASASLRVLKLSGVYISARSGSALGNDSCSCFFPDLMLLESEPPGLVFGLASTLLPSSRSA